MITDRIIPPHIIRLYIWDILSGSGALEIVNNKVPIVPLEDEPILADSGKPYAIYGYSENAGTGVDVIRRGVFALRVISPTTGTLDRIESIVSRAFENADIATEGLNRFTKNYPGEALVGIRFTNAKTLYVDSADASESEQGPVEGVVSISYAYINHLPTPIPASAKGGLWT